MNDVTEKHYNWKDLQEENALTFEHSPYGDNLSMMQRAKNRHRLEIENGPIRNVSYDELSSYSGVGKSKYDIDTDIPIYYFNNLEAWRGENQSTLDKYAHGITKGIGLAGTTFIDGTLGLVYGIGQGIIEGRISGLWDNDLSNALHDINQQMEEWLPNYRSQAEQERKWWQNIGTANFWADGVLKNMGFTVGAFYSGDAWLAGLKALKIVKSKASAQIIGSLLSGFNEGRVEATNMQRELLDSENAKLQIAKERLGREIAAMDISDEEKIEKLKERDENLKIQEQDMLNRAHKAGLTTLLLNTVILSLDNMWQFGKLYSRGFNDAKDLAGRYAAGLAKEGIVGNITEGFGAETASKGMRFLRGLSNGLSEGLEEMNQAWISEGAGYWMGADSPDAYYQALNDPNAEVATTTFLEAAGKGFVNTFGNGDRWEEFAIGALTGLLGQPTFGKANNSDANTWLGKGKSIGISEGLIGEYRNQTQRQSELEETVKIMNAYLNKVKTYENYFAQSQSFTNAMNAFAQASNEFEYNNMADNDDFAAITRFARAGRLDDLKELVNQDFENISDEQLEQIALHTTPNMQINENGTPVYEDIDGNTETGGWRDPVTGKLLSETEEGRNRMRQDLMAKRDRILNEIGRFEESVQKVRKLDSSSRMDESQVNELAWLLWKEKIFQDRYASGKDANMDTLHSLETAIVKFVEDNTLDMPESELGEAGRQEGESLESWKKRLSNRAKALSQDEDGKALAHNLQTMAEFLSALTNSKSALEFGAIVQNNPELMKLMEQTKDEYNPVNGVLEMLSGLDAQEYRKLVQYMNDTVKIAQLTKQFHDRYREFSENPGKLADNRKKIDKAKEKVNSFVNKRKIKRGINSKSVSDIVNEVQDGSVSNEDLDSLAGTLKGTEAGEKIKTAQKIVAKQNEIHSEIVHSDMDESMKKAALNALEKAAKAENDNVQQLIDNFQNEILDPEHYRNEFEEENLEQAIADMEEGIKSLESLEVTEDVLDSMSEELENMPPPEQKNSGKPTTGHDSVDNNPSKQEQDKAYDKARKDYDNTPENIAKRDSKPIVEEAVKLYNEAYEGRYSMSDEDVESARGEIEDILKQVLESHNEGTSYREAVIQLHQLLDDAFIPHTAHSLLYKYLDNLYGKSDKAGKTETGSNTEKPAGKNTDSKAEQTQEETHQTTEEEADAGEKDVNKSLENDKGSASVRKYFKPQVSWLPHSSIRIEYDLTPYYRIIEIIDKKEAGEQLSKEEEDIYKKYYGKFRYSSSYRKYIIAVGKYLFQKNAFSYVDNGNVKPGDTVGFMIDENLNSEAGDIVVLITKNGQVIGNLPSLKFESHLIRQTEGLKIFLENVIKQWKKSGKITAQSKIHENMIGQVPFVRKDRKKTLNEIYENKPFYIGIVNETNSNVKINSTESLEPLTMKALIAKRGQPFLLFETGATGSRSYIPVPFLTPPLNATTANTKLGKIIRNKIESLTNYNNTTVLPVMRDIQNLLSLKEFHVNYLTNGNIEISFVRYGSTSRTVFFNQPVANISQAFSTLLAYNIPFRISKNHINTTMEGEEYNRLIGEIATVNLDIGSTHTVSNWFTVNPVGADNIILEASSPKSTRTNPNYKGGIAVEWAGNKYSVDLRIGKVFNNDGTEYIGADNLEMLAYAESQKEGKTRPYPSKYAGEGQLFDPVSRKFVNKPDSSNNVMESFSAGLEHEESAEADRLFSELQQEQKTWTPEQQQLTVNFAYTFSGYFEGGGAIIEHDYNIPENDAIAASIISDVENAIMGNEGMSFDTARSFLSILKKYNPELYNKVKKSYLQENGIKNNSVSAKQGNVVSDSQANSDNSGQVSEQQQQNTASTSNRHEITYTPKGEEPQTFYVEGSHIYNKDGEEVYKEGSPDKNNNRNKIYANLAVKQGRAKVVEYKGHKYVVNYKGAIISVTTGKTMEWGPNHGSRKAILALAQEQNNLSGTIAQQEDQLQPGNSVPETEPDNTGTAFDDMIEDNAVAKVQEIAKTQQKPAPVRETAGKTLEELKDMAEDNGIITTDEVSEKVWDALPQEQQEKILSYDRLRQKAIMSYIVETYFDTGKLPDQMQDSTDSVINNPKYRDAGEDGSQNEAYDLNKEMAWLKRVLPQFSDSEHLQLVKSLTKIGTNTEVYGMFKKGIIYLNTNTQARGTAYHEAFHAVFDTLLTDEERSKVYEAGMKKFHKTGIALEEALAEDFRRYTQGIEYKDTAGGLIRIWRKLTNWIKKLFGITDTLDTLYADINKGLYADRIPKITDIIRMFEKELGLYGEYNVVTAEIEAEMQQIKKQAIANGRIKLKNDGSFDYALAPNGKRSNLNERQWLQVRTKAFKEWFGDWERIVRTPILDKYKGKLIYAQSGTGKTSIADNITVIDSDYLLAKILGVDTAQAGIAFSLLSPEDKQDISKQYESSIKNELSQGHTVITARLQSMPNADFIIYNSSGKQANERTSGFTRTNLFNKETYHEDVIKQIENYRKIEKDQSKFIKLEADKYLSDILLENPNFNISEETVRNSESLESLVQDFMSSFGISFEEMQNSGYSIDYLNKVIKSLGTDSMLEGSGEMIAFMMQYNGVEQSLITDMAIENGDIKRAEIYNKNGSINTNVYRKLNKEKYFKIIGNSIKEELKAQYDAIKEGKPFQKERTSGILSKIRQIIKQFIDKIFKNEPLLIRLSEYSAYVTSNIFYNNKSLITKSIRKPGDEEAGRVEEVNFDKALEENPYEKDIIIKLSKENIVLTGSAAMSTQISIFRPIENPLHDLDFATDGDMTREQLENKIKPLFPNLEHIRTIENEDYTTETYLTFDRPFIIERPVEGVAMYVVKDKNTNEPIASYIASNLTILKKGVQGKFLDFFTQQTMQYRPYQYNFKGDIILVTDYRQAMKAKLEYGRLKDIWDYNRFIKKEQKQNIKQKEVSKVVDENGEPLVVYRGTRPDSTVHTNGQFRSSTIFATSSKVGSSRYGMPIALFMNIKNPAILNYEGKEYDEKIEDKFYTPGLGFTSLDRKAHKAIELGYDGMIVKNVKDGTNYPIDDYITTSNQIKSATDNNGEFSRENDDIRYREITNNVSNINKALNTINNVLSNPSAIQSEMLKEEKNNLEYQRKQLTRGAEYREWLSDFNNLDEADRQALLDFGLDEKDWKELDDDGRESALKCYGVL